ncbi:hypothetical protein B6U83_03480 [Thermoplasmatales archaeon ex4484_36]|nr:MAG: hypothetical protein B6U83_03480 [Thermoplasmatales archaeon ex4484_36]RLF56427.1 MAG: hypothetical protein DRN28_00435 [Thermoplasmata archaeon]RLF72050.1 MAG: hypothetical protein DRN35_01280 [Thermoplasmata archaeon]RLF74240.1 MAG: hypothetical protein DRN55_00865 [Thermoplasmata archaeon]
MVAPQDTEKGRRRGRSPRGEKKIYRPGDALHIIITHDFAPVANEFFEICRENNFNASEVIRSCIKRWVEERRRDEMMRNSYDEKLLKLLEESVRRGEGAAPLKDSMGGGIRIYRLGEE